MTAADSDPEIMQQASRQHLWDLCQNDPGSLLVWHQLVTWHQFTNKTRHNCKVFTDILRPNSETLPIFCCFLSCFLKKKIVARINKDRTLTNEVFDPFSAYMHTNIYICFKRSVIWPQLKEKQIQVLNNFLM